MRFCSKCYTCKDLSFFINDLDEKCLLCYILIWYENNKHLYYIIQERKYDAHLDKLKCNLRARTSYAFTSKGYSKKTRTYQILGSDYEIVKKHLERQFKKGMNWDNYGKGSDKWHIDHIIPLCSAKSEEEVILLCHYRNLQPLWSKENHVKNGKIIDTQMSLSI